MAKIDLKRLERILDHQFHDQSILLQALTHSSLSCQLHNERLEFIGDGVLGAIIGHYLYVSRPYFDEGELTHFRSFFVNKRFLAKIANSIHLDQFIQFHYSFQRKKLSERVLASTLEAILGAVFVDGGYQSVYQLILRLFKVDESLPETKQLLVKDAKSTLQEYCQKQGFSLPRYEFIEQIGPDHDGAFVVSCHCENYCFKGQAKTVRVAEQKAAALILNQIQSHHDTN